MATIKITGNDEVLLYTTRSNSTTLNINGDFDGGTLTLGYENSDGSFTPYTDDATLTAAGEKVIDSGPGVMLMASMAGAGTPDVNIENHSHYDG